MYELPLPPWEKGVHEGITWALVYAPVWMHFNAYCWVPPGANIRVGELMAHGGVTYGYDDDTDDFNVANSLWVGFDTAHGQDRWSPAYLRGLGLEVDPDVAAMKDRLHDRLASIGGGFELHTWTVEELRTEVKSLAHQIADQIKRQKN